MASTPGPTDTTTYQQPSKESLTDSLTRDFNDITAQINQLNIQYQQPEANNQQQQQPYYGGVQNQVDGQVSQQYQEPQSINQYGGSNENSYSQQQDYYNQYNQQPSDTNQYYGQQQQQQDQKPETTPQMYDPNQQQGYGMVGYDTNQQQQQGNNYGDYWNQSGQQTEEVS